MNTLELNTAAPVVDVTKELDQWAYGQARQIDLIRMALVKHEEGLTKLASFMTSACKDDANHFNPEHVASWNAALQREMKKQGMGKVSIKWDKQSEEVVLNLTPKESKRQAKDELLVAVAKFKQSRSVEDASAVNAIMLKMMEA